MRTVPAAILLCWLASDGRAQALSTGLILAASPSEQPTTPPQAPRIDPEHGAKDAVQPQQNSKDSPGQAANPSASVPVVLPPADHGEGQGHARNAGEDASEFWTAFGVRLRQGEALLVGFTALLFLTTVGLWLATRSLVKDARRTA